MVLLQGQLFVHILKAKRLYNADGIFAFAKDRSDPYVKCRIENTTIAKTTVQRNTVDPKWDQYYLLEVCHEGSTLDFQVLDDDLIGEDDLGILKIPLEKLIERKQIEGEYYLTRNGRKCTGRIFFSVTFYPLAEMDMTRAVENCYFEQRKNCKVTLYQDACAVQSPLVDELGYTRARAFEDILAAIEGARDFIYITGWSVKTDTVLTRTGDGTGRSIGDLLKEKASDGVRVLVMVWNEITSTSLTRKGVMGTYDQDTLAYFAGSRVRCSLVARHKNSGKVGSALSQTIFTHHQKTVICDTPGQYFKRRVVAFVGGLDLTCGRFDTTEHYIYRELKGDFLGDFYNNCNTLTNTQCGPRQPWHDIHSKVEGTIALDVMTNFEERWRKQNAATSNELFSLQDGEYDLGYKFHSKDQWSVQVFRSISNDSAVFSDQKRSELLMRYQTTIYDNSIHKAYVHQIRRAKKFIYIENQYFLGSCHMWGDPPAPSRMPGSLLRPTKAVHLIPIAITSRICRAIEEGEDFAVYVVIPLHPEGEPGSSAVQAILHHQAATVKMMYRLIAQALADNKQTDKHPTDYLSFFCLGKREKDVPDDLPKPAKGSREEVLRASGRHMIYVHSKMAIFDDEYIIVGSANINQRSMCGMRDTEIAVGACQSYVRAEEGKPADGEISQFRKSLCIEHLNKRLTLLESVPGSVEAMREVREEAQRNWEEYWGDSGTPTVTSYSIRTRSAPMGRWRDWWSVSPIQLLGSWASQTHS